MTNHANKHKVTQISMPKAGCGFDRLEWYKVERLIRESYAQSNLTITVYNHSKDEQLPKQDETPVRSALGQAQHQDEVLSKRFQCMEKEKNSHHKNYKDFLRSPGNLTINSKAYNSLMEICAENSNLQTTKLYYNK